MFEIGLGHPRVLKRKHTRVRLGLVFGRACSSTPLPDPAHGGGGECLR
jgi:hypothetical protein